jgi:hypothetical protein
MKDKIINTIPTSSDFVKDYNAQFGNIKADKEKFKAESSVKFSKLLAEIKSQGLRLKGDDFFQFTINNASYMFAKKETIAFASLMAFNKWNNELNSNNEIYDDDELELVAQRIIS